MLASYSLKYCGKQALFSFSSMLALDLCSIPRRHTIVVRVGEGKEECRRHSDSLLATATHAAILHFTAEKLPNDRVPWRAKVARRKENRSAELCLTFGKAMLKCPYRTCYFSVTLIIGRDPVLFNLAFGGIYPMCFTGCLQFSFWTSALLHHLSAGTKPGIIKCTHSCIMGYFWD